MNAARLAHLEKRGEAPTFVHLDDESRAVLDTDTAARHLNREPQTLRVWACRENGPIRPIRICGRLAWPVSELRRVLGLPPVAAQ